MNKLFVATLLTVTAAWGSPALALDVPPGGDALLHQVRSAKTIGVGVLVKPTSRDTLTFKSVQTIEGKLPTTVTVPTDPYVDTMKLVPGRSYTLFLVSSGDKADAKDYALAVSMYSVVETPPREVPAFKSAIELFRKADSDRANARQPLLKLLNETKSPYLQYSAAQSLGKFKVLTKDDGPAILKLLQLPSLDTRAQETLVHEAVRVGSLDEKAMQGLISNPKTSIAVKSFAIDELFRAKGADGLKPVLKFVESSKSPRLRAQVGKMLSKQQPPAGDADK